MSAVIFDLAAIGSARLSPGSRKLQRLEIYEPGRVVLDQLRARGVRLGITTAREQLTAEEILGQRDLGSLLTTELVIVGGGPARFTRLREAAGEGSVFVGDDRNDRAEALAAGLRVAPHPGLAAAALGGARLRYVRVSVPSEHLDDDWGAALLDVDLVPFHVTGDQGGVVYAVATAEAAGQLDDLGFAVDRLGAEDEPLTTEVYLFRDDRQVRTGFLRAEGSSTEWFGTGDRSGSVLASGPRGLFVAVPAGRSVESYHFEEARHGHTIKLLLDPRLLDHPTPKAALAGALAGPPPEEPSLGEEERRILAAITPQTIKATVARYSGTEAVDGASAVIRSRHILHPDNEVAVRALLADLEQIGSLDVDLHPFHHEGQALDNIEAELRGQGANEVVLVTAHLDSTAASSKGYNPVADSAPGADDDGSGVAAVLAIARAMVELSGVRPPKRSVRFVLFNAEEHGLVGSKAYARDQANLRAPIAAVFQMDMIGYNRELPRTFEVHAGFLASAGVQDRSRVLAERVGRAAREVSPDLPEPEVYLTTSTNDRDPAEGRSDHASFHLVGYPACCVCEDFFAVVEGDTEEANPNYHMTSDTFVDFDYAADIARAVAAAAWITANS